MGGTKLDSSLATDLSIEPCNILLKHCSLALHLFNIWLSVISNPFFHFFYKLVKSQRMNGVTSMSSTNWLVRQTNILTVKILETILFTFRLINIFKCWNICLSSKSTNMYLEYKSTKKWEVFGKLATLLFIFSFKFSDTSNTFIFWNKF